MSENPIKVAREKIGWPLTRLAATACIGIDELMRIEDGPVDWNDKTTTLLRNALELRGVKFEDKGAVVGPLDSDVIAAVANSLTLDQKELLDRLRGAPAGGVRARDIREFSLLRSDGLVQFGAVQRLIVFDNENVHEGTADQRVRLSARGRAVSEHLEAERKRVTAALAAKAVAS